MAEDDIEVLFQDFHEVLEPELTREYKGRIFGKSVLEATFRSFYGTDLFLGELLAAEDPERARRFLFRVIQVTYGSDSSDPGWAERTAGAYMAGDAAGSPYTLHDPEQRLYKVATCQPLGYIDAGGSVPQAEVAPGAVRPGHRADRATTSRSCASGWATCASGCFARARTRSISRSGIRGETLTSHVGVFATTGMGKSNLMKVLAGQILASQGRYACLLFDPHGEYLEGGSGTREGCATIRGRPDRLKVYATRAAGAGATALRLSLAELTPGDLQTAYEWSHAQEDAIYRLIRAFHDDWIVRSPRSPTRPCSPSSSASPRARCRWSSDARSGSSTCRASRATRRSRRSPRASSTSSWAATRCSSTRAGSPRWRRSSWRR